MATIPGSVTTLDTSKKPRSRRATVPAPETPANESPALAALVGDLPSGFRDLPLAHLVPHPANPRRDVGDVTELADSIKAQGIRQNLLVVPDPGDPDRYRIVIGHRRHAAALKAGLEVVPCVVDPDLTETQQLELMLVENLQRTDLTAVEEADGYQGLLDLGQTVTQVAKRVGRSRETVKNRMVLVSAPAEVREIVHAGAARPSEALTLMEFLDRPEYDRLVKDFGTGAFEGEVTRVRSRIRKEQIRDEIRALAAERGNTVVETYDAPELQGLTRLWGAPSCPYSLPSSADELFTDAVESSWILRLDVDGAVWFPPRAEPEPEPEPQDPESIAQRKALAAAELARRAADTALQKFAEESGRARLAFAREALTRGLDGHAGEVLARLMDVERYEAIYDEWGWNGQIVDELLPVEIPDDVDGEAEFDLIVAAWGKLSHAQTAVLLLAARLEPITIWEWRQHAENPRPKISAWYDLLTTLGYETTPDELDHLTGTTDAAADPEAGED